MHGNPKKGSCLVKRPRGLNLEKMKARLNRWNSYFKSEDAEDL